jgi:hypothetical protein
MSASADEIRMASRRRPPLTTLQAGIIASLANCPEAAGAYAIVKGFAGMFPDTTVYAAVPQMVELGYLGCEATEGRKSGPHRVYWCRREGLKALKRWAADPPATVLAPTPEMWPWISAAGLRGPGEVLRELPALEERIDDALLDLAYRARKARREEGWLLEAELEYELERAGLEASRQFVAVARGLLEARAERQSSG